MKKMNQVTLNITETQLERLGFVETHTSLRRGYISRKSTADTRKAFTTSKGVCIARPNWNSTQYCIYAYYDYRA